MSTRLKLLIQSGILLLFINCTLSIADDAIDFDIPAQSLGQAITVFAQKTNLNIGADSDLLRGRQSSVLSGKYTAEQALENMLLGTGLTYRMGTDGSITLIKVVEQANKDIVMQSIQVKGELLERSIQDTQTSVAVVTGEELESRSDFDLYDVIERTPGITSAFGDKGFSIRGIDQRGVGGGGTGLTISTTVDGAIISNSNQLTFFGPYSTWDLEQIEVLRGPQSTQTGRNALAGAVVIRSKDPEYTEETKVRVEGGENDTIGGSFAVNTPLIDDKLALRVSADARSTDGFVRNPTRDTDRYDARDQETYRLALRYDPIENLDAIFKFTYSENTGGEDFVSIGPYPDSRINFSDLRAEEGSRLDSYNLRIGYDIDPSLRVESETTYYDAEYKRVEDSDNSPVPNNFLTRVSDVYSFQQEVKLLFDYDKFTGVLGGFYLNVTDNAPASGVVDAGLIAAPFAGLGTVTAVIDTFQDTKNYALFGEVEYQATSNWRLIAGARYDSEEIDVTNVSDFTTDFAPLAPFLPAATTENLEADFEEFLPKAGVVYDFTDDVSLGFTIQRGYRAGGASTNFATTERVEFDPEKTWNYEASFRSQWLNNAITLNANAFYTDWEDQQVDVQFSSNPLDSNTENAGESTVYGGEVEFRALPNENIDIYTSIAYAVTEFDDFESTVGTFDGNEFPFAPELTAAAGATYYFDNGFYISGDVSYTDGYYTDAANTPILEVDSRTLVNARFGYESDQWSVFGYVRNLFDVNYFTQSVADATFSNLELVRTGEPRVVGVVAKFNM